MNAFAAALGGRALFYGFCTNSWYSVSGCVHCNSGHHLQNQSKEGVVMLQPVGTAKEVIRIYYPAHFPPGKCIVAALIPSAEAKLGKLNRVGRVHHDGCFYKPCLINTGAGVCLRVIHRLEAVREGQYIRLLRHAGRLAAWAAREFGMETTISSIENLERAKRVLRMLD